MDSAHLASHDHCMLRCLVILLAFCACRTSPERIVHVTRVDQTGPRILGIIAHPDDETAFAASLYKISTYLHGTCDLAVITNGEGGYKYSTLAEPIYGLELTDETVGRAHLPAIRTRELTDSARILGIRDLHFLDQKDHRYTTDAGEILGPDAHVWDLARVRAELREILHRGHYEFVFTLAPTTDTHAHHKSATMLALDAAERMPTTERPVVLCARVVEAGKDEPFTLAPDLPGDELARDSTPFEFDRRQTFGWENKLDYRVVVNWAIAAHKSQGTMQLAMNHGDRELYYLFAREPAGAAARVRALFESLRGDQFAPKSYAGAPSVR